VYVPPRLDLSRYAALGIVEFTGPAGAHLGSAASDAFLGAVHAAQPGTPVLELGSGAHVFPAAMGRPDPAAIRELAAREHVQAIWVGEITEIQEAPRFAIDAEYRGAAASAHRKAALSVRLLDGTSGATIWSAASERTIPVMSIDGTWKTLPNITTTPIDEARTLLVRDLVEDVTCDLRGGWARP
jgi:hypothetical protein